jgi:hypothetical protein
MAGGVVSILHPASDTNGATTTNRKGPNRWRRIVFMVPEVSTRAVKMPQRRLVAYFASRRHRPAVFRL